MSRALGRYELLRPLARGGMAEVFLARRRAAGVEKWLVVKRIRAERATDVQFLDLFVREARLSMSLAHQNIVPVFDFGRIDDQVFLAMERIEGRDLGSCLARSQSLSAPLSPLLAAFIAAECCQALDYAHRRKSPEGQALGIVHRDVTPRNVLLSWSGEVKLTDFGIAALAGDETTALLGTPAYMAPEQARRETLDARTDVYAVGLVLREMLTGTRARPGNDRDSLVGAARTGELLPWPAHAVPSTLVAIVDKATASSPSDRHTDARALLAELDEFLVGERAAKKADSPTRQLAAWLDRVWGTERDDDASTSGDIHADHLVSFLDDGQLDVIGTGTQRSMLATAGEEPAASISASGSASGNASGNASGKTSGSASVSPFDDTLAAAAKRESTAIALPSTDDAVERPTASSGATVETSASTRGATADKPASTSGAPAARQSSEATSPTEKPARRTPRWLALAIAGALASGATLFVLARDDDRRAASASNDAVVASSDAAMNLAASDAAASDPSAAASDAAIVASSDAAIVASSDAAIAASLDAAIVVPDAAPIARDATMPAPRDATAPSPRDAAMPSPSRDAAVPPARDAAMPPARDAAMPPPRDAVARDAAMPSARRVTINSRPWSNFRVDDEPTEHETPSTVMLAPGSHRVRFHNPELGLSKNITIEVPADRDVRHVEDLK